MIPPQQNWPQHRNSALANSIQLWDNTSDDEIKFKETCADPIKLKLLTELGWLDNKFTYTYNKQGFRSIEFDIDQPAGMALGCSFTQGVGVPIYHAWPSIVSKHIDCPIWNLGVSGNSMDTIFRLADYWIPMLKPKFVLLASTFDTRIEICDQDGNFNNYLPQSNNVPLFYKEWSTNPINGELNFKKNVLAINEICNRNSIPIVTLNVAKNFKIDQLARDLIHPGVEQHKKYATKMLEKLKGLI